MKRILHVAKYYSPFCGGTEQISKECLNALREDGYEQKVICFNHEKGSSREWQQGVEIIRCGCFAKLASQSLSFTYGKMFRAILKVFQPDIIIFHYPNPFVAHYLLKNCGKEVKLILYWHLDITKQKMLRLLFTKQNQKLIARANRIFATSQAYIAGSPYLKQVQEKCRVVPNCINEERLMLTEEIKEKAKTIKAVNSGKVICLAVGRHTEYKGFQYLIRASKFLDDNFVIYIAGSGELTKSLKQEAKGDPRIVFLGLISDEHLKAYLSAADIFCFPSVTKNEAFGLALAEAMYYEKPAVTFTIPGSGVNYVCLNGENGIQVPTRDVAAYANAIRKLADDSNLRKEYGRRARQRVEENFLVKQYNRNIRREIEDLWKR